MPSIAFVAPILPGKTDELREAAQSQAPGGPRREAYEASRERHGIKRELAWLQSTPMGDLNIVYIETDDPEGTFAGLATSQDPFDVWFRAGAREMLGVDIEDGVPAPELLLDFDAVPSAS